MCDENSTMHMHTHVYMHAEMNFAPYRTMTRRPLSVKICILLIALISRLCICMELYAVSTDCTMTYMYTLCAITFPMELYALPAHERLTLSYQY